MGTPEDIAALKNAVIKLASNKMDIVDFTNSNNLHVQRYLDLFTAYVNLKDRVETLENWIVNHHTGNAT